MDKMARDQQRSSTENLEAMFDCGQVVSDSLPSIHFLCLPSLSLSDIQPKCWTYVQINRVHSTVTSSSPNHKTRQTDTLFCCHCSDQIIGNQQKKTFQWWPHETMPIMDHRPVWSIEGTIWIALHSNAYRLETYSTLTNDLQIKLSAVFLVKIIRNFGDRLGNGQL